MTGAFFGVYQQRMALICYRSFILLTLNFSLARKNEIYIAYFIPRLYSDKFCFLSAINVALRQINEDQKLLPNHVLIGAPPLPSYYYRAVSNKKHILLI